MKLEIINLQKLYRLPWTTFNNPNGWIEPTTYCQLACPGCYRGLDLPNPLRQNTNLAHVKKEIDHLKKIRKITANKEISFCMLPFCEACNNEKADEYVEMLEGMGYSLG